MSVSTAQILDGKALAQKIQEQLKLEIATLGPRIGRPPGLAVLMVGDNPASAVYAVSYTHLTLPTKRRV